MFGVPIGSLFRQLVATRIKLECKPEHLLHCFVLLVGAGHNHMVEPVDILADSPVEEEPAVVLAGNLVEEEPTDILAGNPVGEEPADILADSLVEEESAGILAG